ncbi:unnamed protein product, partial [Mesorhabditis belari]|uniref:Syndecan n=1 Tax=Mesorhabditis belari TaxID=2138241 RepID=A0AAF3ES51_9BILA
MSELFSFNAEVDCEDQPYGVLAQYAPCDEQPACEHVYCYEDVRCLLARTTAPILSGCRSTTGRDLYCVCPYQATEEAPPVLKSLFSHFFKMADNATSTLSTIARSNVVADQTTTTATSSATSALTSITTELSRVFAAAETTTKADKSGGGLGGGAIAGIVIGILVLFALIAIAIFVGMRYMKDRRKNHGEYRPQWEEEHHAKDLPHLTPPNIEGLI